jgi:two-component system sensor histidine kinase DesK
VTVEVMDNGRGGDPVEGNGIRGMRERVSSAGGTLEAGPAGAGGFVVTAELPT